MIVQVDRTLDRTVDQSNSSSVSQLGLGLQKLPTNDRMFPRAGHREREEGQGRIERECDASWQEGKRKAIIDQRNLERKFDIKAKKSKKNYFKEEAKERKPKKIVRNCSK